MRDLLRDLFWNATWPNETTPTIPATPIEIGILLYISFSSKYYMYTALYSGYIAVYFYDVKLADLPQPQVAEQSAGNGQR